MAVNLPSGTVTFLFTDIEKSLEVAQAHPEAWESLREHQTTVLRSAIERHRGRLFQVVGDACCAAFDTVGEAVAAAVQAQCELGAEMTTDVPIRVRMGIHTGEAQPQGDSYRGYLTLARAQRIMSAAHGEQILVSNSSAELLRRALPAEASLRDRGELRLRGLLQAEHVWQMTAPGLREAFDFCFRHSRAGSCKTASISLRKRLPIWPSLTRWSAASVDVMTLRDTTWPSTETGFGAMRPKPTMATCGG